jgi:hypothetical protein
VGTGRGEDSIISPSLAFASATTSTFVSIIPLPL